ncbi:Oxidoreductase 2OG-Fe(II) oxygenase family [Penicillium atrosanguineum]|uniref:Oxidoreductase 2OG-Fe(II) oxygenase family n=1 Tax=Penicillium atrosanguineum TaxID=1132637 RepID=A0A9W9TZN6_9EURO|nr:Oxidoreductase 2OG-Fe(II) oxygenase family [Penicillium atrosanguineum]KAJ5300006.1 Oxidoreductase 2OG-Fe(II) oxygenase family [Penicillium atrosanguineum]
MLNTSDTPQDLRERGHGVLNVHRPGCGGNSIPATSPIRSSVALIADLIPRVYRSQTDGRAVILSEHSIGGAIVLAIAAQSDCQTSPVLAVSALGVVPTLGRDLLLPSPNIVPVQYLAAEYKSAWQYTTEAQPRFVNLAKLFKGSSNVHSEQMASYPAAFSSIPVLDFKEALSPSTKPVFLSHLRDALINVGFFYLQNPPISLRVQHAFLEKALGLFHLPLEKKLEIEMVNSPHFLGYSRLGSEITALKKDHREQFDFATELPAPAKDEPLYRNIYGPNQWPDETAISGFRKAIEDYIAEASVMAASFTALIAEALDLPPTAFDQAFDDPGQHKLKLIKYPLPPSSGDNTAGFQGVGAHKDSGFLTFLLQATSHHGLEVQNKAGNWISVAPVPDTFVVNIGRALEALTGGVCTATTHRVSLREEHFVDAEGNSLGPRFSFPVFQGVSPDLSAEKVSLIIPSHIRNLVKDDKVKSDAEATFNEMFRTNIGEATLVARVTSHQDVGQRWYPGVLCKALKGQRGFIAH